MKLNYQSLIDVMIVMDQGQKKVVSQKYALNVTEEAKLLEHTIKVDFQHLSP